MVVLCAGDSQMHSLAVKRVDSERDRLRCFIGAFRGVLVLALEVHFDLGVFRKNHVILETGIRDKAVLDQCVPCHFASFVLPFEFVQLGLCRDLSHNFHFSLRECLWQMLGFTHALYLSMVLRRW